MRIAGLFAVCLAAVSALAGIGIAVMAFAPVPFADSIDFFDQFLNAGGWDGYGFEHLYARHNEHRLVVPRLWFLADLLLFQGTQAFLIAVIVVSSAVHAAVLAGVFRSLGHRGWPFWIYAAAALGALLSPAQWENLVWGFQVQFVQVWLFASLAFMAVARAEGRAEWWLVVAGIAAALASTYSMANGLLVWPLLVALALWSRVRGGPLWLLVATALVVVAVEAVGFRAHPGHGDPAQTIAEPAQVLIYAFRYLANAIGAIGTSGQELAGAALVLAVLAMTVEALVRPGRYRPGHAVLLAIAGFVIGAALVTALGRVNFGLGQANATRYATPSFIFLVTCFGLLLDRLLRVQRPRVRIAGIVAGLALLLVPGLIDGVKHASIAFSDRDSRINAVVSYLAGGYRPEALRELFPFLPLRPFGVLSRLDAWGWGPFADRTRFRPPAALLNGRVAMPAVACRGHVDDAVDDPVAGVVLRGWAADAVSTEHPEWILVIERSGEVVAWGASRIRRDDVGAALGTGWRGRGFWAIGHRSAGTPLSVIGVFADGRHCLLTTDVAPRPPMFLTDLPAAAWPATGDGWTVREGADPGRLGPEPPPAAALPAVGTLGENSHLVAGIELEPAGDGAVLAIPLRTGTFPIATEMVVRDAITGEEIESHRFERPSDTAWTWRVFRRTADPRFRGHRIRVRVTAAGPQPWQGIAVGRPHWIPVGEGG